MDRETIRGAESLTGCRLQMSSERDRGIPSGVYNKITDALKAKGSAVKPAPWLAVVFRATFAFAAVPNRPLTPEVE